MTRRWGSALLAATLLAVGLPGMRPAHAAAATVSLYGARPTHGHHYSSWFTVKSSLEISYDAPSCAGKSSGIAVTVRNKHNKVQAVVRPKVVTTSYLRTLHVHGRFRLDISSTCSDWLVEAWAH